MSAIHIVYYQFQPAINNRVLDIFMEQSLSNMVVCWWCYRHYIFLAVRIVKSSGSKHFALRVCDSLFFFINNSNFSGSSWKKMYISCWSLVWMWWVSYIWLKFITYFWQLLPKTNTWFSLGVICLEFLFFLIWLCFKSFLTVVALKEKNLILSCIILCYVTPPWFDWALLIFLVVVTLKKHSPFLQPCNQMLWAS